MSRWSASLLFVALALSPAASAEDQTCGLVLDRPIIIPKKRNDAQDTVKHAYQLANGAIGFVGRLTIDADGHPRAYAPHNRGLDDTANAGSEGNWFALATDAKDCGREGKPLIQKSGDPAPGFYVSKTTLTAGGKCGDQRNYVHSGEIPYVALSPVVSEVDRKLNEGKFAVVYNPGNDRLALAMHVDHAPAYGIGEGSMALADALGVNSDPRRGGMSRRKLIFIVLDQRMGFPKSREEVEAGAKAAFERWGGKAKLLRCRSELEAAPR